MNTPDSPVANSAADRAPRVSRLDSLVRRRDEMTFTDEYNCKLRRLYPWPEHVETKRAITEFGAIWVVLEPGRVVPAHTHDEEETFIVITGSAKLVLDGEETMLSSGDVVYIPRFAQHELQNLSADERFVFIDIYWDQNNEAPSGE